MEWESILCPALMVLAVVLFALRRSLLRFITCASVIIAAGTVLSGLEAWQGILVFLGSYAALFLLALAFLAIIPKEGRFLVVCNHLFIADPGIVLHCFRKNQLAFLTKKENYKLPIIAKFQHKILCQPIDRENDRQALKSIIQCIRLLQNDEVSVCAFPEGYTSKDGKLHPFRSGVFKIAQKAKVPIVVCTIQNTREIFKNLRKLRPTHVPFHLVKVYAPEELEGLTTTQIGDMVYEIMISDLGENFRPQTH